VSYVIKIGKWYYYSRKVPKLLAEFDAREVVRVSLKTDSFETAKKRAADFDHRMEAYWDHLVATNRKHHKKSFDDVVKQARLAGFGYKSTHDLAVAPLSELVSRMQALEGSEHSVATTKALLGGGEDSQMKVSDLGNNFWAVTQDRVMNKSAEQVKRWRRLRERTLFNFQNTVGDKPLKALTRDDMITFRDGLIDRVKQGQCTIMTANKHIYTLKNILETVNNHHNLGLDTVWLCAKLGLKETTYKSSRLPYPTEFIVERILHQDTLAEMLPEMRGIVMVLAETGARPAENCNLRSRDIHLDDEVPHIEIVGSPERELKTPYSERAIPLVGFALQAMREFPQGFARYYGKSEAFSSVTMKFFTKHQLRPTKHHVIYSLRHSFQDRMIAANVPERIQAALFGHKFYRPEYGKGADLKLKRMWMERVRLGEG